jgi:hypothetical protein
VKEKAPTVITVEVVTDKGVLQVPVNRDFSGQVILNIQEGRLDGVIRKEFLKTDNLVQCRRR